MRRSSTWLPSRTLLLLVAFSILAALGGACSVQPGTIGGSPSRPPNPSSGPIGPPALNLTLPAGWVDDTTSQQERNPTVIASGVNATGERFNFQIMRGAWARFEDVPADVREHQGVQLMVFLKPLLQSQGFEEVTLLGQSNGVLTGLPAIVVDVEQRKGRQVTRSRYWATWYQGSYIAANVSVAAERWTLTLSSLDSVLADLRVPAELLRRGSLLVSLTRPSGWTDFTSQQRAKNLSTIVAFRSPANGAFLLSWGESSYANFEAVPQSQIQSFRSTMPANQLSLLKRDGYQNAELSSQGTGELAGLPALVMEYTARQGQLTYRFRQLVTWYRQRYVSVMMQAPVDRWNESAPGFESLLAEPKLRAAIVGDALPAAPRIPPGDRAKVTSGGRTLYTNSWAVIIGIDRYQKPGLRLRYAVNDARSVRELMLRLGFPAENIMLLLDEQATKQRIQEVLGDELRTQTGLDDRVFVFFAGHGVTLDLPGGGQMGYLLPVESDPDRPHTTGIPMSEVRDIANLIPAKHMFFAIDACYSGLVSQRSAVATSPADHGDPNMLVRGRLREILTAGERDQPVVEEAGHGLFTRRLIEGLSGEADFAPHDGMITGAELAYWLIPRVQTTSGGRQTPFFGKIDGVGDFVFVVPSRP